MTPTPKRKRTLAELSEFTWWMPQRGAHWSDDDPDPLLVLAPALPYCPLQEHTALFLEFADLEPDADAFSRFASEYGPLLKPDGNEPLSTWLEEHSKLRESTLWLEKLPGLSDMKEREEAQGWLMTRIQGGLARHSVTPTIRPNGLAFGVGLQLVFFVPNLAGAMWLQLAVAVDGDRKYKPCPVCSRRYDATHSRSHKQVCSDKCRAKKAYLRGRGGENNDDS